MTNLKTCLREPIRELFAAAEALENAQMAHLAGDRRKVIDLIHETNSTLLRDWTESLWGKNSPYVKPKPTSLVHPQISKEFRISVRMPNSRERKILVERDGYHCRYCGVPVIPAETRSRISFLYPEAKIWGRTNASQHAAFQAMWLQYDHVLPHSRGGDNSIDNVVISCAPCNFGKMDFAVDELGIEDPRRRAPMKSSWFGLAAFK